MGCRLHVAKKYDVQYASIDYFNYLIEEFHSSYLNLNFAHNPER